VSRRQARLALLFLAAALVLLVWSGWLVITLPYRYVTTHRHTRKPSLSNLNNERRRSVVMKRFSVGLFALGLTLGALGAAAVLATSASARSKQAAARRIDGHATGRIALESGQPVVDWNRVLVSIVNTPGAQTAALRRLQP
jgi:hypothetical protein